MDATQPTPPTGEAPRARRRTSALTIPEQIANRLAAAILNGEFRDGERLREQDLAETEGVAAAKGWDGGGDGDGEGDGFTAGDGKDEGCDAVEDVDPATQKYPAKQLPVQLVVVRPCVDPYSPAAHSVHVPDPAVL
jgi:hypothetical protein